jgi:hypothetical protein
VESHPLKTSKHGAFFRADLQRHGAKPIGYGTGMQKPILIVIDMWNDFLDKWDLS